METPAQQDSVGPPGQYEFDSEQTKVISGLASAMRWVAAPLLFLAVLYAIATAVSLIQAFQNPASFFAVIYVGIVMLLFWSLGRWTKEAAKSFQLVVSSSGRDISHLMEALDNLRKMYSLLSVFIKIYVAIIILTLIAAVIAMVTGAFKT